LAALLEGEVDGGIHNWRHPELAASRHPQLEASGIGNIHN